MASKHKKNKAKKSKAVAKLPAVKKELKKGAKKKPAKVVAKPLAKKTTKALAKQPKAKKGAGNKKPVKTLAKKSLGNAAIFVGPPPTPLLKKKKIKKKFKYKTDEDVGAPSIGPPRSPENATVPVGPPAPQPKSIFKSKPQKNVVTLAAAAPNVPAAINQIFPGDCVLGMNLLPESSVDLVFADPPFNIGYDYDVYEDKQESAAYLAWSKDWMTSVHRVLKPDGTFWLAIGDEYAAELKVMAQQIGFHTRSWVIWYYTFGVNCKMKFSRSHAHLFHFVKNPDQFTFRFEELENRIPSARQLVYNDARSNPTGRLPDDTWILRPQDLQDCLTPGEDTWYFPRVAGTFKERAGFHGCQMPEQLLGRIIRFCSQGEELVLDPFSGSGTTLAVAKKLGRNFLGFELSPEYQQRSEERLAEVAAGDSLSGAAEPTMSAPATKASIPARRPRANSKTKPPKKSATKLAAKPAPLPPPPVVIKPRQRSTPAAASQKNLLLWDEAEVAAGV